MPLFNVILRTEKPADYFAVETLTREAFWNKYQPGCDEHYLLHQLRRSGGYLPGMHFIAENDGQLIGSIVYSRSEVRGDDGQARQTLTFGPLSVLPGYQQQGVGATLLRHTLAIARENGERAIIIFGDPAYYTRFGFLPASTFGITLPDGSTFDAFQALELYPGALAEVRGKFYQDETFENCEPEKVEAFDRAFPAKEKLRLPGQFR